SFAALQTPYRLSLLLSVRPQKQGFIGRERCAAYVDLQTRKYCERRLGAGTARYIGVRHAETVRAKGIQPKVQQPVVATEKREVVSAPHVPIISARSLRGDVGDIQHTQCGRILEEQAKPVPRLQDRPVVIPVVPKIAIVRIGNIQIPGLASDLKIEAGR